MNNDINKNTLHKTINDDHVINNNTYDILMININTSCCVLT